MAYRVATRPSGSGEWTDSQWLGWLERDRRLVPLAGVAGDVCALCHGPVESWSRCYPCNAELRHYLAGLLTATYSTPDTFEPLVWGVKDNGQRWLQRPLGALLNSLMSMHLSHAEERFGKLDLIIPVPSHRDVRSGYDHVAAIVAPYREASWATGRLDFAVLRRTRSSRTGRDVDEALFEVLDSSRVRSKRVAVVDDTFTRGGTLGSAAATLLGAGATSVVGISLGRQLNPGYSLAGPLIAAQSSRKYELGECVLE